MTEDSGANRETGSAGDTAHLVYLRTGPVVLTREPFAHWREIQDRYDDYMTSLGPYTEQDVIEFFEQDFSDEARWPFSRERLRAFFASDKTSVSSD